MNNILFESFNRVNNTYFNNEYTLIVPRFMSFFSNEKECVSEVELGKIVSSYYNCMKLLKTVVQYDNFHRIKSNIDIIGSREIIFDKFVNEFFNKSILSNLIIFKKEQLPNVDNYSLVEHDNYIKKISVEGNAKDYIFNAFDNILYFLQVWENDLGIDLYQYHYKKLSNQKDVLYKTESAKLLLSNFLAIYEYSGNLEWTISLSKESTINIFSKLISIAPEKVLTDLSQEAFFIGFLSSEKYKNYSSLKEFLNANFQTTFLDALFSEDPTTYLLNKLLEKVEPSNIDTALFSYLDTDLKAVKTGILNQKGFKVLLHGVAGAGKTEFSKVIARVAGKSIYRLKIKSILDDNTQSSSTIQKVSLLLNISSLFNSKDFILLFDECEEIFENANNLKEQINYALEKINLPCIFIANEIKGFHPAYLRRFHYHISMDVCDFEQKLLITKTCFKNKVVNEEVINYIATQSITNADVADNVSFYLATENFNYLRQKVENKQITQDMLQVNNLEKSIYTILYPENNKYDFDKIIGYQEEKEIFYDLKHYLDNKDKYKEAKVNVSHGHIVHGFPGTGKTSIIKALAKKCNLPILNVETGMMENDASGALNIKKVFNVAKKNAPCIILLDEFEKMALDRRIEIQNGTGQSLMNQLLIELDEIHNNNYDVFVYATCNTINYIDPAISRSGRLETPIEIGLPNAKIRESMFKSLLSTETMVKGIKGIVQHTTGFSYIDIKSIVNNYKISLLKAKGKVSRQALLMKEIYDFMLGKTAKNKLYKEEKELVAYHESGHAFLAYLFDKQVGNISIIPKSGYLGVTMMLQDEGKHVQTKEDVEHEIMILMGGRASEKVFLGKETTGSSGDFNKATNIVMKNLHVLAPNMGLLYADMNEYNDKFSESYKIKVESSVNKVMKDLYSKTQEILEDSKEEVESMVKSLMKKEELVQNEMEGILHAAMSAKNATKMSKLTFLNR